MVPPLKLLRWLPVVIMTMALCAGASVPGSSLPAFLRHGMDKIAHAVAYGLLAASYLYGFGVSGRNHPFWAALATTVICAGYALGEEKYQQFIPGRVSDRFDLRADSVGFLIIICLWLLIIHLQKKAP